jgi:hypothetical protein
MSKIDLRQGDCLEIMKDIPDKSIDLTVTSVHLHTIILENIMDTPLTLRE